MNARPLLVAAFGLVTLACGSKVEPGAAPAAEAPAKRERAAEATGVALTMSVAGEKTSLELSKAIVAARAEGSPLAAWKCHPAPA